MQTYTTDQFTWEGNKGSAEASDLGMRVADGRPAHFAVASTKTPGHVLTFWFWNEEVREGDLLWSTYVATHSGNHVIVTLFND